MALVYAMCLWVLLCLAVESRSLLDSTSRDLNSLSEGVDTLIRVKRNIVVGNDTGQGCSRGTFPWGKKCFSCDQIGRIYKRDLKYCNGKCIKVRDTCQ